MTTVGVITGLIGATPVLSLDFRPSTGRKSRESTGVAPISPVMTPTVVTPAPTPVSNRIRVPVSVTAYAVSADAVFARMVSATAQSASAIHTPRLYPSCRA